MRDRSDLGFAARPHEFYSSGMPKFGAEVGSLHLRRLSFPFDPFPTYISWLLTAIIDDIHVFRVRRCEQLSDDEEDAAVLRRSYAQTLSAIYR